MAYFEGPKGDFFLGEFTASLESASGLSSLKLSHATETYAKNNFGGQNVSARLALDGDPQTGWSCADQNGERNVAVFNLSEPLPAEGSLNIDAAVRPALSLLAGAFPHLNDHASRRCHCRH